jgi:hypothetical protein
MNFSSPPISTMTITASECKTQQETTTTLFKRSETKRKRLKLLLWGRHRRREDNTQSAVPWCGHGRHRGRRRLVVGGDTWKFYPWVKNTKLFLTRR